MRRVRTRYVSPSPRMPPSLKYRQRTIGKGKRQKRSAAEMKPKRMREWLEKLLDEESCNGLSWVDKEEKTFEITWCHASRHDFAPKEHADVLIRYAEHTGRKNVASSSKNGYNSKLKSNFRSALHSLIDCIQIKDTEKSKDKTVKVYQFLESSHPEYKKRKANKNKGQGKNKMRKISSKTRNEGELVENQEIPSMEETSYMLDNIDLPEEAQAFLDSSVGNTQDISYADVQTTQVATTMLPSLPSSSTAISPFPDIAISQIFKNSTVTTLSESPRSVQDHQEISMIFENTEETFQVRQTHSEIPDFRALGVDDTFQEPVWLASQKLSSGGSVRVKKDKSFLLQLEVENVLNQSHLPSTDNILELTPKFGDPFMQTIYEPSEFIPETEHIIFPENTVQQNTEENVIPNIEDFVLNDPNDNSPRVLVQLEAADPNLQGENYDLFSVGHF